MRLASLTVRKARHGCLAANRTAVRRIRFAGKRPRDRGKVVRRQSMHSGSVAITTPPRCATCAARMVLTKDATPKGLAAEVMAAEDTALKVTVAEDMAAEEKTLKVMAAEDMAAEEKAAEEKALKVMVAEDTALKVTAGEVTAGEDMAAEVMAVEEKTLMVTVVMAAEVIVVPAHHLKDVAATVPMGCEGTAAPVGVGQVHAVPVAAHRAVPAPRALRNGPSPVDAVHRAEATRRIKSSSRSQSCPIWSIS